MRVQRANYITNFLFPCIYFSLITGAVTALIAFALKILANAVISLSGNVYSAVRISPMYLPLLVAGAALLGLLAALLLTFAPECKGGGIPAAVAALRGITVFNWMKTLIVLPISALITFLCGVPLGNEGPTVQIGTAVGLGTVRTLGSRNKRGWSRYIMTGGASAGFACATGAPLSGILFALEEAHKRLSPLFFTVASLSVLSSAVTTRILSGLTSISPELFHMPEIPTLGIESLWAAAIVGLVCGLCALLFTKTYLRCNEIINQKLKKLPFMVKLPVIFAATSVVGFLCADMLGSGHSLIEELIEGHGVWYMLIIIFIVRAIFMMIANTSGVTGGIFLPTISFGAILGTLCADGLIALGAIGAEHRVFLIIAGMAAFLGAASKVPITACLFAIEALCGISNILPIMIAVTTGFLVIEASRMDDFSATVIHTIKKRATAGKKLYTIDAPLTVHKGVFIVGKEPRDVLWPQNCVVVSTEKIDPHSKLAGFNPGDVLHVHYTTYDPIVTADELEALVGDQSEDIDKIMRPQ